MRYVLSALLSVLLYVDIATAGYTNNYPLNHTCSPPTAQGGKGYCGPSFCDDIPNTSTSCYFDTISVNYANRVSTILSKTCTQSTDARCASSALKALMVGTGIKAAYCNDEFLVIVTSGETGFGNQLDTIRFPPGILSLSLSLSLSHAHIHNDEFLVIVTSGETGFGNQLDTIRFPPG
jgi:hypothetical protein